MYKCMYSAQDCQCNMNEANAYPCAAIVKGSSNKTWSAYGY